MRERTFTLGVSTLTLRFGDITTSTAEAIVSSDDGMLTMGGGVSRAIRTAGGGAIAVDAAKLIPARLGDVVVTTAAALPARYIFHAVTIDRKSQGPRGNQLEANSKDLVRKIVRQAMKLAESLNLSSLALPAIGSGAAGFSYEDVAVAMSDVLVPELKARLHPLHATIYLMDRFGQMKETDFLGFFEEFGIRSRGYMKVETPEPTAPESMDPSRTKNREEVLDPQVATRQTISHGLARLDQQREVLERQLIDWEEALSVEREQGIQKELTRIQNERLRLLTDLRPREQSGVPVFISYAHRDEDLRVELGKQLRPLERRGLIRNWHDRMIVPGSRWSDEIDDKLNSAGIVLLLVSPDFMHSDYCYRKEMGRALERHSARECTVLPIIIRPVLWRDTPIASLQALPTDAKPVTEWSNIDRALMNVAEGVEAAVLDLLASRRRDARQSPG